MCRLREELEKGEGELDVKKKLEYTYIFHIYVSYTYEILKNT